jgi:hypothetical protein
MGAVSASIGPIAVLLLLSVAAPGTIGLGTPSSALESGDHGPSPALITPQISWEGIDSNQTCSACLQADAQVSVGSGYIVEMVNSSYAVWTSGGIPEASNTLDALFGAGSDVLTDPQVHFYPAALRWFVSADDLSNDQILYGASDSSDPTASWNIEHFYVPWGTYPAQSLLGVDAVNVVVTTNLFDRFTGQFAGSQVWVANESELVAGGGVSTWSSTANSSEMALVPAQPLTLSKTMFLVSDGTGGSTTLDLLSLKGTPPATPVLSSPVTFATNTTSPPNAVQNGSSDLVNVTDGRIASAVWRAGTLWAVATDGCTPSGDRELRSCLHLWELSTAGNTLTQDFVWSSGSGTYDYYPALSTNLSGDLTVVFGESSATLDPSIYVTGQTSADPNGTLESAVLLKQGSGPDAAGPCTSGVCPFGASFDAAFDPGSGDRFWVVGEYTGTNSSTDFWDTWVAAVSNEVTFSATFTESGLPSGHTWSVTLNGNAQSSTTTSIAFVASNGTFTYSVRTPIAGTPGVQYVANPAEGSFVVANASVVVRTDFTLQYRLTTSESPTGAGSVYPSGGWFNGSASVPLGALANSGYEFQSWEGTGSGALNGTANPTNVEISGPIAEQATFVRATTSTVTFTENGLPAGLPWSTTLNGIEERSMDSQLTFNVTDGSYSYTVLSPIAGVPGVEYVGSPLDGAFSVEGANVSETIAFTPEYLLSIDLEPTGAGTVAPASGWFAAASMVNLTAVPAEGYAFESWSGSGFGNYTGAHDPATVSMGAPITETATFGAVNGSQNLVVFGISPARSGTILFDGQSYANSQTATVSSGTYALAEVNASGWSFVGWTMGGGARPGVGSTVITGPGWINASFEPVDHVGVVTTPTGCGSVSVAGNVYANGASLALVGGTYALRVRACSGYAVGSVTGLSGVSVSGDEMTVSGNGSVVATFTPTSSAESTSNGLESLALYGFVPIVLAVLLVAFALFLLGQRRAPPARTVASGDVKPAPSTSEGPPPTAVPSDSSPSWSEPP